MVKILRSSIKKNPERRAELFPPMSNFRRIHKNQKKKPSNQTNNLVNNFENTVTNHSANTVTNHSANTVTNHSANTVTNNPAKSSLTQKEQEFLDHYLKITGLHDVDNLNDKDRSIFHFAVINNWMIIIKLLAKLGKTPDPPKDKKVPSPLMVACHSGNFEMAKLLLNEFDSTEQLCQKFGAASPLDIAFARGHFELAQYLVETYPVEHEKSQSMIPLKKFSDLKAELESALKKINNLQAELEQVRNK
jgi:hypothetical protein